MTIRHDDAELPRLEPPLPPSLPDQELPRLPPPTTPEAAPLTAPMFGQPTFPLPVTRGATAHKRKNHVGRWTVLVLAMLAAGGGSYLALAKRGDPESDASVSSEVSVGTNVVDGTSASVTDTQDELGAAYIGPLTFGWSAGCTVRVAETVTRRGRTAELTYGLRIVADPAGLLISFVDMTVVTIDAVAVPPGVAEQAVAAFRLPSFVVDHEGAVVEVRGTEEMIAELIVLFPDMAPMAGPEFVAAIEASVASKYWESWGGFWAGFGSIDEVRFEATADIPTGNATVETDVVVESLGTNAAGDVELRVQQIAEGDDLLNATATMMDELGAADSRALFTTARRVVTIDTTTDPHTLRPRTASLTLDTEIGNGVESRREVETHDWAFDWSAPECGG